MKRSLLTITSMLLCLLLASGLYAVTKQTNKTKPVKKAKTTSNKIVGSIDGFAITYDEFNRMLTNYISYNKRMNKDMKTDDASMKKMNDDLWNQLVGKQIYDKEIARTKLTIPKAEVENFVNNNPPAEVKKFPQLQKNGKFDISLYRMALEKDPGFKQAISNGYIQGNIYDYLFRVIKSRAKVKEDSVKQVFLKNNDKVSGKVIFFDTNKITSVSVADSEIVNYYNAHKEDYKRGSARKYNYVKFAMMPSKEDSLTVKTRIDSIYNQLMAGADMGELAKKYSQDPGSAQKGGDIDFIGKGRTVPEFEAAAFNTEVGKYSKPVATQFGWHILKVTDKRKNDKGEDEVRISHILLRNVPGDITKQRLKANADSLYNQAKKVGLANATKALNYKMTETPEFYKSSRFPSGIQVPDMVAYAFANPVGSIPSLGTSGNGDFYVMEISDTLGEHYLDETNADVHKGILNKLEREKKLNQVHAKAAEFGGKYKSEQYLEMAAKEGWEVVEVKDLIKGSPLPTIGTFPQLVDAMLGLEVNQYTMVMEFPRGSALGYVTERIKPDLKQWDKEKAQLVKTAKEAEESRKLNSWYSDLYSKVKIEDKRKDYYNYIK